MRPEPVVRQACKSFEIVGEARPWFAPMARQWLTAELRRRAVPPALIDDVTLVAGELVANAITHTHGPVSVRIDLGGGNVTVIVTDSASDLPPRQRTAEVTRESGRGLCLVDALSAVWGWSPAPHGKRVWALISPTGDSRTRNQRYPPSTASVRPVT